MPPSRRRTATAGAWIAPEGGQEIWSKFVGERDEMTIYETSAYWEIQVGATNSFVAAPWLEQNFDTDDGWRGEAVLGFKQTLHRGDERAVALQGALWISHSGLNACGEGGAQSGCSRELRCPPRGRS